MLTIGGLNLGKKNRSGWQDQDPFPQGLGIFNITNMEWVKNGDYKADAEEYRTPQVLQQWYMQ